MFKQTKRWLAVVLTCTLLWCSCSGLSLHSKAAASPYLEEDVYYCIRNATYATYLTVGGASSGANAYLTHFTGNDNQLFTLKYDSSKDAYQIIPYGVSKNENYCLTPYMVFENNNVSVSIRNGYSNEYWTFVPYSSTSTSQFSIRTKSNNTFSLTGNSGTGSSGGNTYSSTGNVYINTFGSTNLNQYWYIVKYSSLLQGNVLSQTEAQGRLRTGSSIACSLPIGSSGSYIMQTAQPNVPYGTYMDTVLSLYNSSNALLKTNDDYTGIAPYSKFTYNLTAGQRYILRVNEGSATNASVPGAYIAAYKSNSLLFDLFMYSNLTYDFKKISDYDLEYNCLAYALGYQDHRIEPVGNLTATTALMERHGYRKVSQPVNGCIIAYGTEDFVGHFARYSQGIVTAKLGDAELVQHSKIDAYYDQSTYGNPVAYYSP